MSDTPETFYRYIRVDEPEPEPASIRIHNGHLSTHHGWLSIEHDDGASWWGPGEWAGYVASDDPRIS